MFKRSVLVLTISLSIFLGLIYIVFLLLNFFKLEESFYLTSDTSFLENNKINKIYNFCDEINNPDLNIININNREEVGELLDKKEFGNIAYICKINFSEKLTPDFSYFHNVKILEEIKNNKIVNSELDNKDKINLFLDFLVKKGVREDLILDDKLNNLECKDCIGNEEVTGKKITGIFFGDGHFGRGFEYFTREGLKEESDYFEKFYENNDINNNLEDNIHRRLYGFDIVGFNLETAVSTREECTKSNKSIVLNTLPKYLSLFKQVGFNYYNMANNHSFDCGKSGFNATKAHLEENNLNYFGNMLGDENILKQEINGIKLAFIGINDTFWNIAGASVDYDELTKKIKEIKKEGYKIIINIHWGEEYKLENNARQEELAKKLVEAGANLIIGHHPHVVQNYEVIDGVPVFYSLGNFVFDQPFEETLKGMAVMFELGEDGVKAYPIYFTRDNKRYFIDEFLENNFK